MNIIKGFILFLLLLFVLFFNTDFNMSQVSLLLFVYILVLLNICNCLNKKLKNERIYFIKTLSHDLRVASLAQIRALDVLQKNVNDEQLSLVNDINESCKYSFDMITMLLNTYKFKNGECVLDCEEIDSDALIKEICDKNMELARDKNIVLNNYSCTGVLLNADKSLLSKVISIFLQTALINSRINEEVNIYTKNNKSFFSFSVFYQGLPLTGEEYNRIFSEKHSYTTVGHGIKMQFCKKIIDFHKGFIKIQKFGENRNLLTFTIPLVKKQKGCKTLISLGCRQAVV